MMAGLASCRLCLRERELCESHFMPAALYPKTKTITYATQDTGGVAPSEVKDYLLCRECEGRFNQQGESEVLRQLAPGGTNRPLPLLALVDGVLSLTTLNRGLTVYSGPSVGLATEPFAYFALSLAWRSAVHRWTLPNGNTSTPCDLGPHQESIRRFLLGEAPFPSDIAVVMSVCTDKGSREVWIAPGDGVREEDGCSVVRMQMLGVILIVYLGATIPFHIRQLCCVSSPSKPFTVADCSEVTDHMLGGLAPMPTAPKRGMTALEVEAMLGRPERRDMRGPKAIYFYPEMEVTFTDGKVSRVDERAARGRRARRAARSRSE